MATVFIPGQLQDLTDGQLHVEVTGSTVGEVIKSLEESFPGIRQRLCDGDDLRASLQVSINDEISTQGMMARVPDDCELHFLPAIGGG